MRAVEIVVIVVMLAFAAYLLSQHSERNLSVVIGFREYVFSHPAGEIGKVRIYGDVPVADFFFNNSEFTVTFDPSDERDNGYFSKIGFNLVSKLNYFFIDRNERKVFRAKIYNELNESDRNIILLRGPNSGAIKNGISLEGNTLIIEGLTYDELEKASERVVVEVFIRGTGRDILAAKR